MEENNRGNYLLTIAIISLIVSIGLLLAKIKYRKLEAEYNELKMELVNPVIKTDTVIQYDTIKIEKPIPKYITRTEEKVDTVIEYASETDTIYVPISLPIISKEYSDERYKALIKGVEFGSYPSLESLEIFETTNYITTEKTIVRKPKWGWNLQGGVGAGYNPWSNKIEPTISLTIGYGYRF